MVLGSDSKTHLETRCCAIFIYNEWLTGLFAYRGEDADAQRQHEGHGDAPSGHCTRVPRHARDLCYVRMLHHYC